MDEEVLSLVIPTKKMFQTLVPKWYRRSFYLPASSPAHTHTEATNILKDTFHPVSEQHEESRKSALGGTTSLLARGPGLARLRLRPREPCYRLAANSEETHGSPGFPEAQLHLSNYLQASCSLQGKENKAI